MFYSKKDAEKRVVEQRSITGLPITGYEPLQPACACRLFSSARPACLSFGSACLAYLLRPVYLFFTY